MNARTGRPARQPAQSRARAPRSRPAGPAHGRPANHVTLRRDALERQADAFAARARAGEHAIATGDLLRTRPRRFDVDRSAPNRLTPGLRAELEPVLGGDLGAVSLHVDDRAAQAVDEAGAEAVTAGAHVFFGSGAFSPGGRAGRDLLVHELTHVLQQTAVSGEQTPRARDVTGEGPAQASPRAHPLVLTSSPRVPEIGELLTAHGAAGRGHAPLEAELEAVRAVVAAGPAAAEAHWQELEARLLAGALPGATDELVLAFQVDLLKRAGRFAAVAALVERFPRLPTAFYDERAYAAWPDDAGYLWLRTDWEQEPLLAGHAPAAWLDTYRTFLLGITRSLPAFGEQPVRELLDEEVAGLEAGGMLPNERRFAVLWTVDQLEQIRLSDLRAAIEAAGGDGSATLSAGQRLMIARGVRHAAEVYAAGEGLEALAPELRQLLRDMAPDLQEIADAAIAVWEEAARFGEEVLAAIPEALAVMRRVTGRSATKDFEQRLLPSLDAMFALRDDPRTGGLDAPLPASEYLGWRDAAIVALAGATYAAFEAPILTRKEKDPNVIRALAYVQIVMSDYRDQLADVGPEAGPDELLAHRLRTGRATALLGELLGLRDLTALGNEVATASLAGQARTQLALLGDWHPDPGDPTRLNEDFHPFVPIEEIGLTPDELVDFYLTAYYRDFSEAIARELPDVAEQDGTVITRAEPPMTAAYLPQRHVVDGFEVAINPDDSRTWGQVLQEHPKSAPLTAEGVVSVWPQRYVHAVFAWTLPDFGLVVARVREFEPFNRIIAAHRLGVPAVDMRPGDPAVAEVEALDWQAWMRAFIAAFAEPSEVALAARATFDVQLSREREAALTQLEATMREASTAQRHERVETVLGPALAAYDPGDLLQMDVPASVAGALDDLLGGLGPERDRPLQEAAALLELAPALGVLAGERRLEVIMIYKPRLEAAVAAAADQRESLRPLLPQHGASEAEIDAWIAERAQTLAALVTELATYELTGQRQFGFQATGTGADAFLTGIGHGERIAVGDPFTIDGVEWRVLAVEREFTYHPRYGTQPSLLVVDGVPLAADDPRRAQLGTPLLQVRRGKDTIPVDATADDVLAPLARAVTMTALVRQLEALAEFIEVGTKLTMDLLELVPGAGQVVMASRLAISIFEFVASPEFDLLVNDLLRDPDEAFRQVLGVVEQVFTPALLWEGMLFGGEAFAPLRVSQRAPAAAPPARTPRTLGERLARLVRRLLGAGRLILRSLLRTQTGVRWRMEGVQLTVLRYPLLARALRLVADNLDVVVDLASRGFDVAADVGEAMDAFGERVAATAIAISELEMPHELFAPGELAEVVVEIILARLPKKYRIAGDVLLTLLDLVNQRDAVFVAIEDAVERSGVPHPNDFWQANVLPKVAKRFQEARDEFAAALFAHIARYPPLDQHLGTLQRHESAVIARGEVEIEPIDVSLVAEPLAAPGGLTARPGAPVALPGDPGRPLAPTARARYEQRFGQDLGHVRVHDDPAAGAAAAGVGARALAAGSNVYLAGGLGRGERDEVMAHELTHVVQQTGPRPLGRSHPSTPAPGSPGRGLRLDPRREAQAHAVARRVEGGIGDGGGADGVQPDLPMDIIWRILYRVTSSEASQTDADREAAQTRPAAVPKAVQERVVPDRFLDEFQKYVRGPMRLRKPFDDPEVGTAIRRQLQRGAGEHIAAIRVALDATLLDSLVAKPGPKPKGRSRKPPPPPEWALDVQRFADALALLVFGESGILLDIELTDVGEAPVTIRSMTPVYVHLANLAIRGNNTLWIEATKGLLTEDERSELLSNLRAYLAQEGVTSAVWETGRFRLTQQVIDDVKALAAIEGGGVLTPQDLPPKKSYLAAKDPAQPIGLRLATHRDFKGLQKIGRESHHITQYLLLDYFNNDSNRKAFPLLDETGGAGAYPAMTVAEKRPAGFSGGGARMNLSGLRASRGGSMPTISLARITHRKGKLHIGKEEGDDLEDDGDAQSDRLDSEFNLRLGEEYRAEEAKGTAAFAAYRASFPGGDPALGRHIHSAMIGSYHWMRGRMEPKLQNALHNSERTYFNDLARDQTPPGKEITLAEMDVVWKAAKTHSRTKLADAPWGWTE